MSSYQFNINGGTTVELHEDAITISVKGIKGWLFQRVKPRSNTIAFKDIVRIDYKKASITVGYIRVITPDYLEYPSSLYVAEHDPQAFIFEKEDMAIFEQLMTELHKVLPNIPKQPLKM